MEAWLELLKGNLGGVGTFLFLLLIWFDLKADAKKFLQKLWSYYEKAQSFAEEKKLFKIAQAAYHTTEEVAKKTPNLVDDKVAYGLGVAVRMLRKAGFDPEDTETRSLIEGHFQAINSQAETAERLAGAFNPFAGSGSGTPPDPSS
jgi:hypothetical protein